MRQHDGNPFAPIQILTGDTRELCVFLCGRLHDDGRSFQRKSRIERRFESSPESRGSQTSGVLLVLFVHAKSTENVPFAGSFEVLQTSNQRTQTTTSHNPIKSFRRPRRHSFGGLRRTKTCHRQLFARPSRKFAPFGTAHFVCFFRRPQRLLFLHVVRRIAAYLLGGGLVKFAIAQRYLAHRLVAR